MNTANKIGIIISAEVCDTPQKRITVLEEVTWIVCEQAGVGPDDGIMALLTAATHTAMRHSGKSGKDLLDTLAYSLGCATTVADCFFSPENKVVN